MRSENRKQRPDSWSPKTEALALSLGSGSVSSLHQDGEVLECTNHMKMVRTKWSGLQGNPEDMATWVSYFGYSWGTVQYVETKEVSRVGKVEKLAAKNETKCAARTLGWLWPERSALSWRQILSSWLACLIDKRRKKSFCSLFFTY